MAASSFGQYLSTAMEPTVKVAKKAGKVAGKVGSKALGPAATLLGAYDAEQALQKGASIPEAIATPFGLEGVVEAIEKEYTLSPEEREIARRTREAAQFDTASESMLDEGLQTLRPRPQVTEQESRILEQGKERVKGIMAADRARRADEYNALKEQIKFRLGLEDGGPADPSRRRLLKGLAALGAIPVLGPKIFKPAAKGIETLAPVVSEGVSKGQEIFGKLVSTVITKGKMEPEKKGITKYKYKDIEVEDNPGETIARFKTDKGADAEVVYRKPTTTEEGQRIPGEFEEYQQVFKGGDDVTEEMEIIDTLDNVKKAISE